MVSRRAGLVSALAGFLLVVLGLYSFVGVCRVPGTPCPSPSLNEILLAAGVALLMVGVLMLALLGWRGDVRSAASAAAAAVPLTWTLYEIARQSGCPLLGEGAAANACLRSFGEMTAPVLSVAVAAVLLVVGWRRSRGLASA